LKSEAVSVYRQTEEKTAMDHRLPATLDMAREFSQLFVNRRAYTIQSVRPHPDSGRDRRSLDLAICPILLAYSK